MKVSVSSKSIQNVKNDYKKIQFLFKIDGV